MIISANVAEAGSSFLALGRFLVVNDANGGGTGTAFANFFHICSFKLSSVVVYWSQELDYYLVLVLDLRTWVVRFFFCFEFSGLQFIILISRYGSVYFGVNFDFFKIS